MKKLTLLTFLAFISILKSLDAQTVAGNLPSGMTSTNPNFSISVSQINTSAKDSLDIDCDGTFDIVFDLYKGSTVVDGANTLNLYVINQAFDFCNYAGNWSDIIQFYNVGDTMNCTGPSTWNNDTIMLGNYGCMLCSENPVIGNKYIAYSKNSSDFGWIKLSHNLQDAGSTSAAITLTVQEIASACLPNGVSDHTITEEIKLATIDANTLKIIGLEQIVSYQLISINGKIVSTGKTASMIDISNLPAGVWLLRIEGISTVYKFISQ